MQQPLPAVLKALAMLEDVKILVGQGEIESATDQLADVVRTSDSNLLDNAGLGPSQPSRQWTIVRDEALAYGATIFSVLGELNPLGSDARVKNLVRAAQFTRARSVVPTGVENEAMAREAARLFELAEVQLYGSDPSQVGGLHVLDHAERALGDSLLELPRWAKAFQAAQLIVASGPYAKFVTKTVARRTLQKPELMNDDVALTLKTPDHVSDLYFAETSDGPAVLGVSNGRLVSLDVTTGVMSDGLPAETSNLLDITDLSLSLHKSVGRAGASDLGFI